MEVRRKWQGGVIPGEANAVERAVDVLDQQRAQRAAAIERWGDAQRERMTRLCRAFPSLRDMPGTDPWDPRRFLRWFCSSDVTTAGDHAGRFVLLVWNSSYDWAEWATTPEADGGLGLSEIELRAFSVVDAVRRWDNDHMKAFQAWVEVPFWP